jgi:3-deoxy-D-manno-octulosonate 8-phosphate phosphatase (KDO 8-P phosphatase)
MPSHLPAEVRQRLRPVRALVLDVDGVLTDGTLIYTAAGEEAKRFSVQDGLGMRLLLRAGIQVAVISGRSGGAVATRCRELGLREDLVLLGSRDKGRDLDAIERRLEIGDAEVAAMGDDLPDLPMIGRAAFSACPADAAPEVVASCDHVCRRAGGSGAVREVAELILKGQGRWVELVGRWQALPDAAG